MTVVERARRKAELLEQAVGLVERLRANESEHARLLAQRDGSCRELKKAGATGKELEEAFGVSRSRLQQILRGASP